MLFLHKGHYTTNVVSSYARLNVSGGLVEKVFVESGTNIQRRLVSVSEGLSAFFEEYYGSLHGVKDRNFPLHYLEPERKVNIQEVVEKLEEHEKKISYAKKASLEELENINKVISSKVQ